MTHIRRFITLAAAVLLLSAAALAQAGFPFQDESLRYAVNWPSGLSLGEAGLAAHHTKSGWSFNMTLDAAVPGFAIADKIRSAADAEFCSAELERDISHGSKKSREKTTFDQAKGVAHRETLVPEGGGKSDLDLPFCAKDVLDFVYYGRRELGQGRVPAQQQVYFGSAYSARMDYTGAVTIKAGEKQVVTDHLVVYLKGPQSDFNLEVFYARDAARTPLLVKVPSAMGTFSMELVR